MDERYGRFSRLLIDRPHPRVLRVVMNRPDKLNAADGEMHSDLTEICVRSTPDLSVNAVLLTWRRQAFSAGGDLDLVDKMMTDFDPHARLEGSARHGLQPDQLQQAGGLGDQRTAGRRLALAILADISIAANTAKLIDGHTAGVAWRSRRDHLAALRHGQGQVIWLLCEAVTGEEAERIGLAAGGASWMQAARSTSRCGCAEGAPNAIRWTKYALNNWLRAAG
jgi:enoyl-CoA hydratase